MLLKLVNSSISLSLLIEKGTHTQFLFSELYLNTSHDFGLLKNYEGIVKHNLFPLLLVRNAA